MEPTPVAPPESTEPTESFLRIDDADSPPTSPSRVISKQPPTAVSNAPPLDTVEQQNIIADEVEQSDEAAADAAEARQLLEAHTDQDADTEAWEDLEDVIVQDPNLSTTAAPASRVAPPAPRKFASRPGLKRGASNPRAAFDAAQTKRIREDELEITETLKGVPPRPEQRQQTSFFDAPTMDVNGPGMGKQVMGLPSDPLSVGQLRKVLQGAPKAEETSYAFQYADSSSFEEELEELFDYTPDERQHLLRAQTTFAQRWSVFKKSRGVTNVSYASGDIDWQSDNAETKIAFLHEIKEALVGNDHASRSEALNCALYLAMGCWIETAIGRREGDSPQDGTGDDQPYAFARDQRSAVEANVLLISDEIGVGTVYTILQTSYDEEASDAVSGQEGTEPTKQKPGQSPERWMCLVLLYALVDLSRRKSKEEQSSKIRDSILQFEPPLLDFLMTTMIRSRWDESEWVPPAKVLLLAWKTILLTFGGIEDVTAIKKAMIDPPNVEEDKSKIAITASPIDYHLFRQEIISKYPAYNPPPTTFPFDPESNSIVPPLQDHSSRSSSMSSHMLEGGPGNVQAQDTSIIQQPIHIATPAPSPPPSPGGPGKGMKKQNYQTNQMFPFLYPPLDETSNDLGGRGSTELQDLLAGRKWSGKDIPTSILEAADLFSQRIKATPAMKQLWEERVRFLKFERGQDEIDALDLSELDKDDMPQSNVIEGLKKLSDVQRNSLERVEQTYKDLVPRLQSVVSVLLKVLLQAVTTLITQPHGIDGLRNSDNSADATAASKPGVTAQANGTSDTDDPSLNDVIALRSQEITVKAVSAIVILLLKWFRLSHVLKFEYLSQLLLDGQYIQLVLKLFNSQALERVVNFKCERKDLNFFTWCRSQSRHPPPPSRTNTASTTAPSEEAMSEVAMSPDDAAPPPIARHRESPESTALQPLDPSGSFPLTTSPLPQMPSAPASANGRPQPPSVDELGVSTTVPPPRPITHYSWRNFFTAINHSRILQKLLKAKPHRQLLMVQSKYSLTLKKHVHVPETMIRLYTLKILKGQVPYCHRKWRQSNMGIITAIYLTVKPGLRDEWLSGLDIEQEIGDALPMEQALRALTWWYHLRCYPDQMRMNKEVDEGGDAMSAFVRSKLDAIDRKMEEEDAKMVDEILGINGDADTMTNGFHGEGSKADEDTSNRISEHEQLSSATAAIGDTFDIDYDPFTSSGHDGPESGPRTSLDLFLASAGLDEAHLEQADQMGQTRPTEDIRQSATSSRGPSRRASLKETLLGHTSDDDDFFQRELDKMPEQIELHGSLNEAEMAQEDEAETRQVFQEEEYRLMAEEKASQLQYPAVPRKDPDTLPSTQYAPNGNTPAARFPQIMETESTSLRDAYVRQSAMSKEQSDNTWTLDIRPVPSTADDTLGER